MATPNENVTVVTVTNETFATANGFQQVFALTAQGRTDITVTQFGGMTSINWEGPQRLFSSPRTNFCTQTDALQNWNAFGTKIGLNIGETSPDGQAFAISFPMSAAVGGASGSICGVSEPNFTQYSPNTTYVETLWVKADAPSTLTLGFDGAPTSPVKISVGTTWTRVQVNAVSGATITSGVAIYIDRSDALNADLPGTSKVYFAFPQIETPTDGFPTSVIINPNTTPLSKTDFTRSLSNVIFPTPPVAGTVLSWSGQAYWVDETARQLVTTNMLGGISWRFDQSTNLITLIKAKQNWYAQNQDAFWNNWYTKVFNLPTVENFGMSVWAFILNLPLSALGLRDKFPYWAFGVTRDNFVDTGQTPPNPSGGNFPPVADNGGIVTPREKIAALRLKYYTHISPRSIEAINNMLSDVFKDFGSCWVLDNEDMSMTYVFNFPISSYFHDAMINYRLLPKPAGVKLIIQSA